MRVSRAVALATIGLGLSVWISPVPVFAGPHRAIVSRLSAAAMVNWPGRLYVFELP